MTKQHHFRFITLWLCAMSISLSTARSDQRPNIIFVLFDDLGSGTAAVLQPRLGAAHSKL